MMNDEECELFSNERRKAANSKDIPGLGIEGGETSPRPVLFQAPASAQDL
jgi:hypothetical protein